MRKNPIKSFGLRVMIPNDVALEETRHEPINNDSAARGVTAIRRTIGIRVNINVTASTERNFQTTYFSRSPGAVKSRFIVPAELSRTAISARPNVSTKKMIGRIGCTTEFG